jgi:hypothetical protein
MVKKKQKNKSWDNISVPSKQLLSTSHIAIIIPYYSNRVSYHKNADIRTDNTMAKRKRAKGQTTIYKTYT